MMSASSDINVVIDALAIPAGSDRDAFVGTVTDELARLLAAGDHTGVSSGRESQRVHAGTGDISPSGVAAALAAVVLGRRA
jgi:hypothetical protein